MEKRLLSIIAVLAITLAMTDGTYAQAVGAHAGFDFDSSDLYIGGNFRYPLGLEVGDTTLDLNGDASYWVTSDGYNLFIIDANMLYAFEVEGSIDPYVGAGLVISFFSADYDVDPFVEQFISDVSTSSTDFGINVKGGAEFGSGGMRPFGEAGFYIKDGGFFYAQGGVRFKIGDK